MGEPRYENWIGCRGCVTYSYPTWYVYSLPFTLAEKSYDWSFRRRFQRVHCFSLMSESKSSSFVDVLGEWSDQSRIGDAMPVLNDWHHGESLLRKTTSVQIQRRRPRTSNPDYPYLLDVQACALRTCVRIIGFTIFCYRRSPLIAAVCSAFWKPFIRELAFQMHEL